MLYEHHVLECLVFNFVMITTTKLILQLCGYERKFIQGLGMAGHRLFRRILVLRAIKALCFPHTRLFGIFLELLARAVCLNVNENEQLISFSCNIILTV